MLRPHTSNNESYPQNLRCGVAETWGPVSVVTEVTTSQSHTAPRVMNNDVILPDLM